MNIKKIKSLFKKSEFIGRGLKLMFLISPCLSENEREIFGNSMQNSFLKNYFSSVDITYYDCEDNSMWFKIFCPEAIFTIKQEDIARVYRQIFDTSFSFVKSQVNELGFKLQGYSFEFVYRMFPEEASDIMPLPEEGSILNYEYNLDLETEEEKKWV